MWILAVERLPSRFPSTRFHTLAPECPASHSKPPTDYGPYRLPRHPRAPISVQQISSATLSSIRMRAGCHTSRRRLPFRPRGPELRCHHRLHKVWSVMATNAEDERKRSSARRFRRARHPRDPGIGSPTPRQMLERSRTFQPLELCLSGAGRLMLERAGRATVHGTSVADRRPVRFEY